METDKLSSQDILQQIQGAASGLPEGVPDAEEESYGWNEPEMIAAPTPSPTQDYEPEEEYDPDKELADHLEQDHLLREQWRASETERMTSEFGRTGAIPRSMNFEEWKVHREIVQPQEEVQKALTLDLENLRDRYPRAYPHFARKMNLGQIAIPSGIEAEPNALEQLLVQAVLQDARKLDTETLAEVIGQAEFEDERRPALRTHSLDVVLPARKTPVPRPKPRQQTYSFPDISQNDFNEMFSDWARKHPEKMGRRR